MVKALHACQFGSSQGTQTTLGSNIIGSVADSSDASSSPRSEPFGRYFYPGEGACEQPGSGPPPLIGLFVYLEGYSADCVEL
jgi:hypothetical protein